MHVGGLSTHGHKQLVFVATLRQHCQFDATAVRRESAHHPASGQLQKGVWTSDCLLYDLVVVRTTIFSSAGPHTCRGHERLGFAGNQSTIPFSKSDKALSP